jgi:hypothetical protein
MLNFHTFCTLIQKNVIEDDFTSPYHQLDFTAMAFNTAAIVRDTMPTGLVTLNPTVAGTES